MCIKKVHFLGKKPPVFRDWDSIIGHFSTPQCSTPNRSVTSFDVRSRNLFRFLLCTCPKSRWWMDGSLWLHRPYCKNVLKSLGGRGSINDINTIFTPPTICSYFYCVNVQNHADGWIMSTSQALLLECVEISRGKRGGGSINDITTIFTPPPPTIYSDFYCVHVQNQFFVKRSQYLRI